MNEWNCHITIHAKLKVTLFCDLHTQESILGFPEGSHVAFHWNKELDGGMLYRAEKGRGIGREWIRQRVDSKLVGKSRARLMDPRLTVQYLLRAVTKLPCRIEPVVRGQEASLVFRDPLSFATKPQINKARSKIKTIYKEGPVRRALSETTKRKHNQIILEYYHGYCPSCRKAQIVNDDGSKTDQCQYDHYSDPRWNAISQTWPLCTGCHDLFTFHNHRPKRISTWTEYQRLAEELFPEDYKATPARRHGTAESPNEYDL